MADTLLFFSSIFWSFVSFMTVPSRLMLLIKIRIASSTLMDKIKSQECSSSQKISERSQSCQREDIKEQLDWIVFHSWDARTLPPQGSSSVMPRRGGALGLAILQPCVLHTVSSSALNNILQAPRETGACPEACRIRRPQLIIEQVTGLQFP